MFNRLMDEPLSDKDVTMKKHETKKGEPKSHKKARHDHHKGGKKHGEHNPHKDWAKSK